MHCNNDDVFESSKLGTHKYWVESFKKDLINFTENNDVGEIWFGVESINRLVKWLLKQTDIAKDAKIIDVGCGNGMMLIELAIQGFINLVGVDYANEAIILANLIASKKTLYKFIKYETGDLLNLDSANAFKSKYDIILDKGVYDAICLASENVENRKRSYISNMNTLCNDNGLFIITSCNWTEEELNSQFSEYFTLMEKIPTATFSFGGKIGNKETVLVYRKHS